MEKNSPDPMVRSAPSTATTGGRPENSLRSPTSRMAGAADPGRGSVVAVEDMCLLSPLRRGGHSGVKTYGPICFDGKPRVQIVATGLHSRQHRTPSEGGGRWQTSPWDWAPTPPCSPPWRRPAAAEVITRRLHRRDQPRRAARRPDAALRDRAGRPARGGHGDRAGGARHAADRRPGPHHARAARRVVRLLPRRRRPLRPARPAARARAGRAARPRRPLRGRRRHLRRARLPARGRDSTSPGWSRWPRPSATDGWPASGCGPRAPSTSSSPWPPSRPGSPARRSSSRPRSGRCCGWPTPTPTPTTTRPRSHERLAQAVAEGDGARRARSWRTTSTSSCRRCVRCTTRPGGPDDDRPPTCSPTRSRLLRAALRRGAGIASLAPAPWPRSRLAAPTWRSSGTASACSRTTDPPLAGAGVVVAPYVLKRRAVLAGVVAAPVPTTSSGRDGGWPSTSTRTRSRSATTPRWRGSSSRGGPGVRGITGPYVDYLCTDQYTLTFTAPLAPATGSSGSRASTCWPAGSSSTCSRVVDAVAASTTAASWSTARAASSPAPAAPG